MGSFIFCCILWLNDCWSKLHVLHLEYYWGWKAARTTKEQNFQAVFHICSITQVCSKVIWGIQAVNSKWKREWHRYEKKKQKVRYFLLFWTVSCSYITALLLFLSKIRVSRLSLSSSTPVLVLWQPGKIQVSWERWIRGDSPLLPIDSRVKEPRTRTLWVFLTALITLCLIFGTVGQVFHGFLRTRRLSFLCSECQSTFQEKKKKNNQNIAPRTARLKQFHPRFLWSYP